MYLLRLLTIMVIAFGFMGMVNAAPAHKSITKAHVAKSVVNINAADASTLETLKGIGQKKADAIVAYRKKNGSFKAIDDLAYVRGINKKFIARLQKNNPGIIVVKSGK